MQIEITQEFCKSIVSGLRRELKQFGGPVPSHNQMLEALAKSLGHNSYAQLLQAAKPAEGQVATATRAPAMTAYQAASSGKWLCRNDRGQLDLGKADNSDSDEDRRGHLFDGVSWLHLEGTQDKVPCSAGVSHVKRLVSGDLDVEYEGGSEVFWDDQKTDTDNRGVDLWSSDGMVSVPQDMAFIAPAGLMYDCSGNLDPELEDNEDIQVRKPLVDGVFRFLKEFDLQEQAFKEMGLATPEGEFSDDFEPAATQVTQDARSALGLAQFATGFAMHRKEFRALARLLLD